ncbi:hypothetical protein [Vibrio phage J14]|nr:hypothetical protein [Vibrio phage J14]
MPDYALNAYVLKEDRRVAVDVLRAVDNDPVTLKSKATILVKSLYVLNKSGNVESVFADN